MLSKVFPPPQSCPNTKKHNGERTQDDWRFDGENYICKNKECRYRISLKSMSVFRRSRLPLPVCLTALWEFAEATSKGERLTAHQLHQKIQGIQPKMHFQTAKRLLKLISEVIYDQPIWRGFSFWVDQKLRRSFAELEPAAESKVIDSAEAQRSAKSAQQRLRGQQRLVRFLGQMQLQNGAITYQNKIAFPKFSKRNQKRWQKQLADNRFGYERASKKPLRYIAADGEGNALLFIGRKESVYGKGYKTIRRFGSRSPSEIQTSLLSSEISPATIRESQIGKRSSAS
jgi:hypothetical protein